MLARGGPQTLWVGLDMGRLHLNTRQDCIHTSELVLDKVRAVTGFPIWHWAKHFTAESSFLHPPSWLFHPISDRIQQEQDFAGPAIPDREAVAYLEEVEEGRFVRVNCMVVILPL